jgi:hypothetical protein
LNLPLFTYAGDQIAVQMERHCAGTCAYNVGATSESVRNTGLWKKIDQCSDVTGAPFICASGFLGTKVQTPTSHVYNSLGNNG